VIEDVPPTAGKPNCVPASDHQLLTSEGWMFYEEASGRMADTTREPLKFASYVPPDESDPTSGNNLVYEVPTQLVYNPPEPQDFVEFSDCVEAGRWTEAADVYGRYPQEDAAKTGHHLSVLATPEHDMYVHLGRTELSRPHQGKCKGWKNPTYSKVKARDLLNHPDGRLAVRFLPNAAGGVVGNVAPSPTSVTDAADGLTYEDPLPFMAVLGLTTEEQKTAFLELYGFWLGDGLLAAMPHDGLPFVRFAQVKDQDKDYIRDLLNVIGLREYVDYRYCPEARTNATTGKEFVLHVFTIRNPAWAGYFSGQYGAKYKNVRNNRVYTKALADGNLTDKIPSPDDEADDEDVDVHVDNEEEPADEEDPSSVDSSRYNAFLAAFRVGFHGRLPHEDITSAKWFWYWVWRRANAHHARALLKGLRFADGDQSRTDTTGGTGAIFTSSARFRDEIQVLALHAGYTTHFALYRTKGTEVENRKTGELMTARHDQWKVNYVDNPPAMAVGKARPEGDLIRLTHRENDGSWCVTMPSGFVWVRRAYRDPETGVVTLASRPIVAGNCFRLKQLSGKEFVISAESQPEKGHWMQAIKETVHKENLAKRDNVHITGYLRKVTNYCVFEC